MLIHTFYLPLPEDHHARSRLLHNGAPDSKLAWWVALLCTLAASLASGMRHGVPFQRGDVIRRKNASPKNIATVGDHLYTWTVVHDPDTFFVCPESKLLDFPLYTLISDPSSEIYIQPALSTRGDEMDFSLIEVPQAQNDTWVFHENVTFQIHKTEAAHEEELSGQVFTAATELKSYLNPPLACMSGVESMP